MLVASVIVSCFSPLPLAFFTLPWRGRVDRRCEAEAVGDAFDGTSPHPTPLASLATLPLQGRVEPTRGYDSYDFVFASWIACQTRAGLAGMSMWRMP